MPSTIEKLIMKYPELESRVGNITEAFQIFKAAFDNERTLYVCGNGGSAADAEHIVGELMKGFKNKRPLPSDKRQALRDCLGDDGEALGGKLQMGLRSVSLCGHPSLTTAFANDVDSSLIFAQQLFVLSKPGDVLLGISTSGNSLNVLRAIQVAKACGVKSVALTGVNGGKCAAEADCAIAVPEEETYLAQELHLPIYHALCAMLEEEFYGES